jgi:hypothetical protein
MSGLQECPRRRLRTRWPGNRGDFVGSASKSPFQCAGRRTASAARHGVGRARAARALRARLTQVLGAVFRSRGRTPIGGAGEYRVRARPDHAGLVGTAARPAAAPGLAIRETMPETRSFARLLNGTRRGGAAPACDRAASAYAECGSRSSRPRHLPRRFASTDSHGPMDHPKTSLTINGLMSG